MADQQESKALLPRVIPALSFCCFLFPFYKRVGGEDEEDSRKSGEGCRDLPLVWRECCALTLEPLPPPGPAIHQLHQHHPLLIRSGQPLFGSIQSGAQIRLVCFRCSDLLPQRLNQRRAP